MSESYKVALEQHKGKIELLISKYEQLVAVNMRLRENLQECRQELAEKEQQIRIYNIRINELEQQIDKLQLTGAFKSSASDIKEAKQNITRLVREIDKCIALLND
ncbi:MAG: hypothetical protein IKC17_02400 [Bacteroidales bacterium]|nr:hypothetical protein [Bacteroidales bacterium]